MHFTVMMTSHSSREEPQMGSHKVTCDCDVDSKKAAISQKDASQCISLHRPRQVHGIIQEEAYCEVIYWAVTQILFIFHVYI